MLEEIVKKHLNNLFEAKEVKGKLAKQIDEFSEIQEQINKLESEVKKLKEIQYYSHVIHLVSTVEGQLSPDTNPYQIFADTFPAGTLSGAPKYKAIELISQYENQARGFYGGAIGCLGFNGEINQAIVIRSFLSLNHTLFYQAGAGIVQVSDAESELQEVNNKLGALKKALIEAENIGNSAKLL
jgi:anthranilate synthase component 1